MRPIVLTILDGWGYSKNTIGNAILDAQTPTIDYISKHYPSTLLQASGKAVGLAWGEAGNSEVGHLTIGAGRIIFQVMSRINRAIEMGEFFNNQTLLNAIAHSRKNNSKLHIIGLLTSGSVHAYLSHLRALIEFCSRVEFSNLKIHLFTDGKDSSPTEGKDLVKEIEYYCSIFGVGKIATIIGRDYAMDRNKNWDLTEKSYKLLVGDSGIIATSDPLNTLEEYYKQEITDSKIPGLIFDPSGTIEEGDSIFFFNFREDSIRQLVRSFIDGSKFNAFPIKLFEDLFIASMVPYFEDIGTPFAFEGPKTKNTISETISLAGKKQLHIAETEKYAHVTFFFNGLTDKTFPGEEDVLIESYKSPLEYPQMRAEDIGQRVVSEIDKGEYEFIVINLANPDMLAHTGNLEASIKGIETVDSVINNIMKSVLDKNGIMVITADHGHAESMTYKSGDIKTRHETSPVPFYLIANEFEIEKSDHEVSESLSVVNGLLADVAPTILSLMNIEKPDEMTGQNLLKVLK